MISGGCVFSFRLRLKGVVYLNNTKSASGALAALICVLVLAVVAAVSGLGASPASCTGADAPRQAVTGFFDALCSGDFSTADGYVAGYSGLGLNGTLDNVSGQKIFDALTSSYSYKLSGEARSQSGKRCFVQTVDFTHLDLDDAADGMDERFAAKLEEITSQLTFDEIYVDGSYRQELIDQALTSVYDDVFADGQAPTVTESIDVELEYTSDGWRVVVNDRLADAILGRTEAGR